MSSLKTKLENIFAIFFRTDFQLQFKSQWELEGDNITNLYTEINTKELRVVRLEFSPQEWNEFGWEGKCN